MMCQTNIPWGSLLITRTQRNRLDPLISTPRSPRKKTMYLSDCFENESGLRMFNPFFLCFVFFLAGGCAATAESGRKYGPAELNRYAGSWKRHSEKWRKAVGEKAASPDIVNLRRKYRLDIDSLGRARWEADHIFMVLTQTGVASSSMLQAYWSPWYEKRPMIYAEVMDPQGRIRRLDQNVIEEGSAAHGSEGIGNRRRLRAPLPGVMEGSVIRYRIIQEQHRTINRRGDSHAIPLSRNTPILETLITITAPADKYLKHKIIGTDVEPVSEVVRRGQRKITYKLGPLYKKPINEPHLPPDVVDGPRLLVSTARTWDDAAESLRQRMENKIRPDQVRDIVEKILEQTSKEKTGSDLVSTEQLIGVFTDYIHRKVRYTGVWLDEGAIDPATPKVTLERTFGDCKDMAVLLVSMLRVAGKQAYPALIYAGVDTDVRPDMPGVSLFNHAIVKIISDEPIWTDPTARWTPPGRLPPPCRHRWALVLRPKIKDLVRTSGLDIEKELYAESRRIELASREGGKVVEITRAHGTTGEVLRENAAHLGENGFRKLMESYFENAYGVEKPDSFSHSRPGDLTQPFTIELAGSNIRSAWTDAGHAAVRIDTQPLLFLLDPFLSSPPDKNSRHRRRKHDLWLNRPYSAQLHYDVSPPIGFELDSYPENGSISFGPARLSWKSTLDKTTRKIKVDLHFTTGKERYTATELKEFWRSYEEMTRNPPNLKVVYKHETRKLMDEGKFREAIDLHQKLIDRHPKQPCHRNRLVIELTGLGFIRDALKHARLNVKNFPEDDVVRHILAWVLEHNEFGIRYGLGYRRQESIAEYYRVLKLNPERSGARRDLVDILLKNRLGLAGDSPEDMDAAIEQMLVLINEDDYLDHTEILLQTLFRRGRYSEVETLAEKLKGSDENDFRSLRVAAVAMRKEVKDGASLAQELGGNREEYRRLISAAATVMLNNGHYRNAYLLLKPIAKEIKMESNVKLWQQLQRFSPSVKTPMGIDDFVRTQLYFMLIGELDEKKLNASLIPEASERLRETFTLFASSFISGFIQQLRDGDTPVSLDFFGDFMMHQLRIRHEGDENRGWISRVYFSDNLFISFYSVHTPGGIRLRSLMVCRDENGRIVDDYLTKGNLKASQMLLDWVAENEESSSDPFSGSAFSHVWTSSAERDIMTMRLAAATLMAQSVEYSSRAAKRLLSLQPRIRRHHLRLQLNRALAKAYTHDRRYKEALKLYQRLHADYPRSASPFNGMCDSLLALKRYNAVIKFAEQRLKEKPEEAHTYYLLLAPHWRNRDFPAALKAATRWIENGVPHPGAYITRALVYASMGEKQYEKAMADIKSAEQMDSSSELFLRTTGIVYVKMGRLDLAMENLKRILNNNPGREPGSDDYYLRGRIAQASGLIETAIDCMKKVKPDDFGEKNAYYEAARNALIDLRKEQNSGKRHGAEKP